MHIFVFWGEETSRSGNCCCSRRVESMEAGRPWGLRRCQAGGGQAAGSAAVLRPPHAGRLPTARTSATPGCLTPARPRALGVAPPSPAAHAGPRI